MRLVADCGNTRIKLGVYDHGQLQAHARMAITSAALDAFIEPWAGRIIELIVLPGAQASAMLVANWWTCRGAGRPLRTLGGKGELDLPVPDLGQYPGCGLDRILAGFAAGQEERQPVVVVDAGTATTITAWQVKAGVTDPQAAIRFVGGLILPSARACLTGLATMAPALPRVDPLGPDACARQHDTINAIAAAMGIGYGPMVAACLVKLAREANIHHVVATGGEIDQLIAARVAHPRAHKPTLVLDGLARWCAHIDR